MSYFMQDKAGFQKLVKEKKFLEASEDFIEVRRGSISSKNSSLMESGIKKGKSVNALSSFSPRVESLPSIKRKLPMSNRSGMLSNSRLLDESMLSVISQRSSLKIETNMTTEFSMNHLAPLNNKLRKIAAEENIIENEVAPTPIINLEEKINAIDKQEMIRRSAPVRKIYPNSNVTLICVKDKIHYFAVPYEGYCFPMIVNFNMKVLVNVLVSFKYMRPTYIDNEFEFTSFVFKITKPPEPIETYVNKFVYLCITPLCDFKTNLSVKFESRDFKNRDIKAVNTSPKTFAINYKEYMAFSENFNRNLRDVRMNFAKKDHSKIDLNVSALQDFSATKKVKRQELAKMDSERCLLAKMKADWLEVDRVKQITDRKVAREQEIIRKRLVVEHLLENLMFKSFQRSYIVHHHLIVVMEAMHERFLKLKKQKQDALVKVGASARIVNFFCKFKKETKCPTILTTVQGKKDKIFEIKVKDATYALEALHLFGKLNRISTYEKALNKAGFLFQRCSKGATLNKLVVTMMERIRKAQKSFRYTIAYRRTCIKVYSKLMAEIIQEIDDLGSKFSNSKLRIKGVLNPHEIEEIVEYLFEHYLYRFIQHKLGRKSQIHYETLANRLHEKPWGNIADDCLELKRAIKLQYPNCIHSIRLKAMRNEFAANDPLIISVKNKARDEQIKKLKGMFGCVQEHFRREKFSFDFDDIDAKLFLMNFFRFDSNIGELQIEDLLFGTEYTDPERFLDPAGSASLLLNN